MLRSHTPRSRAALMAQYLQGQQMPPIYGGVGEGLARMGSQIVNAYMLKALMGEEEAADKKRNDALTKTLTGAIDEMSPNHLQGAVNPITGQPTPQLANGDSQRMAAARMLLGNPDTAPLGWELATRQQQQLKPNDYLIGTPGTGGVLDARTGRIVEGTRVAPTKETDNVLVEIADPTDPTGQRGIMVPRSQAAGKPTKLSVRERQPKMQTYFDEEGRSRQLDSNDPEDQKIIKELGLVTASPSEGERTSKGYLDRMSNAENIMDGLVSSGFAPGNLKETTKYGLPLGNYMVSPEFRQYRQAQEDWVRAKLRKESGAVIADEEMAREIETYFPKPGDDPKVQEQKRKARIQAEKQLATSAGILGRSRLRTLDAPPADGGWKIEVEN